MTTFDPAQDTDSHVEPAIDPVSQYTANPANKELAHRTAGLGYCLWLLGIVFGVTALIGAIISHTKLKSAKGTHAYSHLLWQLGSFWVALAGIVISAVLWPAAIAQMIAITVFFVWLFSGLIGSWYLSKSRRLRFLDRNAIEGKHPHHLRRKIHKKGLKEIQT